jgi:predicted nucleic acid-binding protein
MTPSAAESVFVDTSAILPYLHQPDEDHARCHSALEKLRRSRARLVTSSYVIHECLALLQSRFGLEAVRQFEWAFMPLLRVVWVDEALHTQALSALLAANRKAISLTDWTSFKIMGSRGLRRAFSLDGHFREQGFELV